MRAAVRRCWRGLWPRVGVRQQKLEGEIASLKTELDCLDSEDKPSKLPAWAERACGLLEKADAAAAEATILHGYEMLNAARRVAVEGYDSRRVRAAATALREEAKESKLSRWRSKSIRCLLAPVDGSAGSPSRLGAGTLNRASMQRLAGSLHADDPRQEDIEAVLRQEGFDEEGAGGLARFLLAERDKCTDEAGVRALLLDCASCDERAAKVRLREALRIRDEGLANTYRKAGLRAERLRSLYASLSVAVVLILLVALLCDPDPEETFNFGLISLVGLFGATGASLSAILSSSRDSSRRRVPEVFNESNINFFRPLFGVGAALGVYVAYLAGIQSLATDPAGEPIGPILTLAFAAGFSESLVVKAVGAAGGGSERSS